MKLKKILDIIVYVAIFSIPILPIIGNTLYYIICGLVIIVNIIDIFTDRKIVINYFEIGYILLISYSCFTLIYCIYEPSTNYIIKEMLFVFVMAYGIARHLARKNEKEIIKTAFDIFAFSTMIVSIYLFIFELPNMSLSARLGQVLYQDYGTYIIYSYLLIISICYLMWKIFFDRSISLKKNICTVLELLILIIASFLSGTRKCIVCVLIFLFFLFLYKNRKNIIKLLKIFIVGIITVFVLYNLFMHNDVLYQVIGKRIESMITEFLEGTGEDQSIEVRNNLKNLAIDAFQENPILGCGMNNFAYYSAINGGEFLYAHNNYLELLASGGIIALFLYYGSYFILIYCTWKKAKEDDKFGVFALAFLIMNLISDYSTVSYYRIQYILTFVQFSEYVFISNIKRREKNNEKNR